MKQVICMNWGTAYGADYVNRLYSMVARNLTGPFRFVCLTDNEKGIRRDVHCRPCPASIDDFFSYEPQKSFLVIRNWTQPDKRIGNTSVYRFRIGSHPYLLTNLEANHGELLARYSNSQTYISENVKEMDFWPDEWCRSFKVHCVPKGIKRYFVEPALPRGTRIVAFPGQPNPPDAAAGYWPAPWYKRIYKQFRPATWVEQHWK
jgi:hypothetical protein